MFSTIISYFWVYNFSFQSRFMYFWPQKSVFQPWFINFWPQKSVFQPCFMYFWPQKSEFQPRFINFWTQKSMFQPRFINFWTQKSMFQSRLANLWSQKSANPAEGGLHLDGSTCSYLNVSRCSLSRLWIDSEKERGSLRIQQHTIWSKQNQRDIAENRQCPRRSGMSWQPPFCRAHVFWLLSSMVCTEKLLALFPKIKFYVQK